VNGTTIMWLTTLYEHPLPALQWGTVLGASLVAAFWDLRSRRIPNLLTGPLLLCGWCQSAWLCGGHGLLDSFVATLLLATPFVILFVFAGGGAGDAKLMGALGSWLGVVSGIAVLLAVCLCGMVIAVAFALSKRRLGAVLANISGALVGWIPPLFGHGKLRDAARLMPGAAEGQKMPYGPAIFAGTALAAGSLWVWKCV
jgi:prepilin peptidase CpaA